MLDDAGPESLVDFGVGDHVGETGQGKHLEALAGAKEGVGCAQRVAEVDVVVGGAVDKEERPTEIVYRNLPPPEHGFTL